MKKLLLVTATVLLTALSALFWACEDDDNEKKGREAGQAFCDCIGNGKSESTCKKEFDKKYGNNTATDFVSGFNSISKDECGFELKIIYTSTNKNQIKSVYESE